LIEQENVNVSKEQMSKILELLEKEKIIENKEALAEAELARAKAEKIVNNNNNDTTTNK
jgi:hypothetical protein